MRRRGLGCAVAAALIVATFAPSMALAAKLPTLSPTGGYGLWSVVDAPPSPLDGTPNFTAQVNADNTVLSARGNPQKPILAFFCDHDGLTMNILWPANIDISRHQVSETLIWKLDQDRLSETQVGFNKFALIGTGRGVDKLIHLWALGKVLAVRVPDRFGGQDATFQLDGLDLVVAHLEKIGCARH